MECPLLAHFPFSIISNLARMQSNRFRISRLVCLKYARNAYAEDVTSSSASTGGNAVSRLGPKDRGLAWHHSLLHQTRTVARDLNSRMTSLG